MPTRRICLAQVAPRLGRVNENLEKHLKLIRESRQNGDHLLVFPELSLTGYQLKDLAPEVAMTKNELLELFAGLGEGPALEIVVGYMERSPGFRFYNAMAHLRVDADGYVSLLHNHRKVNLPTYTMFEEQRYYSHGKGLSAYDSPVLGRAGMLVCEDFWHSANSLVLSMDGEELEGARVMIVGANSPARGVGQGRTRPANADTWNLLARHTAIASNCLVLVCQRVGVEDGFVFIGGSEVIGPGGESLAQAELFDEQTLRVELELDAMIREARINLPGGAIDDFELLSRELTRIRNTYLTGENE